MTPDDALWEEPRMAQAKGSALVTGGSRGIGRAIAVRLAQDGYDVGFCYQSAHDAAKETARLVEAEGRRAYSEAVDVRDYEAVRAFVEAAQNALGPVATAVACAGTTRDHGLALMPPQDWSTVIGTNLDGAFHLARGVTLAMCRASRGSIVFVSSVSGIDGNAGQANYSAAKAGMHGLALSLAREVGRFGVRVNVVAPGLIDTDMLSTLSAKKREAAQAHIPLGKIGDPGHVADAVSFLASEQAAYITGSILRVDGGLRL